MAYSNGKLIRYTGSSWQPSNTEDFFFKVYLNTPVAPSENVVSVDYLSGSYKGVITDDNGDLTTDIKFLMAVMVDDTVSISWSDPVENNYSIESRLPNFFENLLVRTKTTPIAGFTGNYEVSYVDFWTFTNTEINRSIGFTNAIEDIQTYASTLFQRGLLSTLLGSVPLITNGLNEQSIFDAFFGDDIDENATKVGFLVLYLEELNALKLTEIYNFWNNSNPLIRSAWGTGKTIATHEQVLKDTIKDYFDVSEFVVKRWAKSFIPLALIIADGDNISSEDVSLSIISANSSWNDSGSPIYTIGIGKSQSENFLRKMSSETNGAHFYVTSESDWDNVETALLHGGDFSLFTAYCNKTYDFDNFTWISQINAIYTPTSVAGNGASCTVEIRWSADRINFTSWIPISSGVPYILKKLILVLEYQIKLSDGWDGNSVIRPKITQLTHTIVTPSVQYLFTPPQKVDGMIFETLLSAVAFLPDTATATWGISRGESVDFSDYSPVHIGRKGALPNRQSGVQFTPEEIFEKLSTTTEDGFTYYVLFNNAPKTWVTNRDKITVFQQITSFRPEEILSDQEYTVNGENGSITFGTSRAGTTIRVTIRIPSAIYTARGEPTSTKDYKTYYLTNGRWSRDNSIIVLVNNKIVRGGYWINPEDGTITFNKEKDPTDVVTVYVEFSDVFRVGVEIRNYDPSVDSFGQPIPLEIKNFALMFNTLENVKLLSEVSNTSNPYVTNAFINPRTFSPAGTLINPTYHQRLTLNYKFNSADNASEDGTQISWWRYRAGQSTAGLETESVGGFTYIRLTDYNNRITQKKSDVGTGVIFGSGDKIFIKITPSDGYNFGPTVATDIVTLSSDKPPFIATLKRPDSINTTAPSVASPTESITWSVSASSSSTSFFEAGTYYVGISFINNGGETLPSKLKTVVLTNYQSIKISAIDLPANATGINYYCSASPNSFLAITGTLNFSSSSSTVSGTGTVFQSDLKIGDSIYSSSNVFLGTVKSIPSNTSLILTENAVANFSGSARTFPVYLGQTNDGNVETIITELSETVYPVSANMNRDTTTGLRSAPITDELTAFYIYRNPGNPDNVPDNSIIEWYSKDNESIVIFTGKVVPANTLKAGVSYIFKVTPYNGARFGTAAWSSTVLMRSGG